MGELSWNTILLAAFTFLAGGGGVFIINLLKARSSEARANKQQDTEIKLSETEKAFNIYKEIVSSLKHDIEQLTNNMQLLEKQYIEVREEKVVLKTKYDAQENLVKAYETKEKEHENKIADLEKQVSECRKAKPIQYNGECDPPSPPL